MFKQPVLPNSAQSRLEWGALFVPSPSCHAGGSTAFHLYCLTCWAPRGVQVSSLGNASLLPSRPL